VPRRNSDPNDHHQPQHIARLHRVSSAHVRGAQAAATVPPEACLGWRIPAGLRVSRLPSTQMRRPRALLTPNRTCATGALRIHYAHRVYYYTKLNPSPTYDISWEALGSWVATSVEANVAVICASAPALKVYWGPWFGTGQSAPRTFGWYHRGRQAQSIPLNSDSGYVSGSGVSGASGGASVGASGRATPKKASAHASVSRRANSLTCNGVRRAESPQVRHVEYSRSP
jgi:hypothetical protein